MTHQWRETERKPWHNSPVNGVYRIKNLYMGQCAICGKTHFTFRNTSEKAITMLIDLGWTRIQNEAGQWGLRCDECTARDDYDPLPEAAGADDVFEDEQGRGPGEAVVVRRGR